LLKKKEDRDFCLFYLPQASFQKELVFQPRRTSNLPPRSDAFYAEHWTGRAKLSAYQETGNEDTDVSSEDFLWAAKKYTNQELRNVVS